LLRLGVEGRAAKKNETEREHTAAAGKTDSAKLHSLASYGRRIAEKFSTA
jgi:hypothetical protein